MKIGITGASGKMGRALIDAINKQKHFKLNAMLMRNAGDSKDALATDNIENFVKNIDVVVDFSSPQLALAVARSASMRGIAFVSGTTGLDAKEQKELENYAKKIPIVHAGNMSVGINLVQMLVAKLAKALDQSFDIEIIEKHHKNKIDAPSGTALMLAKSILDAKNLEPSDNIVYSRVGQTGTRPNGKIGISSIRAGSMTGEHDILFASDSEMITISHHAFNRDIFANGALKACDWVIKQKPGLYSMLDVLQVNE